MKKFNLSQWNNFFEIETQKDYFLQLWEKVENGYKHNQLFPDYNNLFKSIEFLNPNDIKAIIIGQDPYHNDNQANGLAFAVNQGTKLPPSLKNIFTEIQTEFGELKASSDLMHWSNQGVLLLNTVLTVKKHTPLSCKNWGWEKFTLNLIKYILDNNFNIVVICFGKYAQKFISTIKNKNHYFINCIHPSPLSAHNGFFNSNVFKKTNEYLEKHNKKSIEW